MKKLVSMIFAVNLISVAGFGPDKLRPPLDPPWGIVETLESYNVDTSTMSVSGFSSGGAMAIQYHVSHSADLIGVAAFAAAPYACGVFHTFAECLWEPEIVDVQQLIDQTDAYSEDGLIDATSNMANDKVYIYTGTKDKIELPEFALMIYEHYSEYVRTNNILLKNDIKHRHGFPTENNGIQCNRFNWKGGFLVVNDCDFDGAYHSLNHIYGDLQKPDRTDIIPLDGDYYQFDQTEFYDPADSVNEGWDEIGYVYVPSGCVDKQTQCRLHVHFHGCSMGRYYLGDKYIIGNGIREVAELNNIIVIYPQVRNCTGNEIGCWDFFRYSSPECATKNGPQIIVTERMVKKAAGQIP